MNILGRIQSHGEQIHTTVEVHRRSSPTRVISAHPRPSFRRDGQSTTACPSQSTKSSVRQKAQNTTRISARCFTTTPGSRIRIRLNQKNKPRDKKPPSLDRDQNPLTVFQVRIATQTLSSARKATTGGGITNKTVSESQKQDLDRRPTNTKN